MNPRQKTILALMEQRPDRDLYEAVDGKMYLTYSAGLDYPKLGKAEVWDLAGRGLIVPKWPSNPELNCWTVKR